MIIKGRNLKLTLKKWPKATHRVHWIEQDKVYRQPSCAAALIRWKYLEQKQPHRGRSHKTEELLLHSMYFCKRI